MIKGIGIDLIELQRVKDILERQPKIVSRVLTKKEIEQFNTLFGQRKIEFFAGRFASKEAYSKAVGTGIGENLSFLDIEIEKSDMGKPFIYSKKEKEIVHLTITHTKEYALAQVIIEEI